CTRPSLMNWLDSTKNTTIMSTTSMSEIMLISGSSRRRGLRFMTSRSDRATSDARRSFAGLAFERIGEPNGVLLHRDDDAVDFAPQESIRDERRNGDHEARRGTDERLGDAAGERARITHAAGLNRIEGLDDAGDGAEQSQERRHPGDRAERVEKPFELVDHVTARVFEALYEHLARAVTVLETRRQDPTER